MTRHYKHPDHLPEKEAEQLDGLLQHFELPSHERHMIFRRVLRMANAVADEQREKYSPSNDFRRLFLSDDEPEETDYVTADRFLPSRLKETGEVTDDRTAELLTLGRMVKRFAPKTHDEQTREGVLDGAKAAACGRDDVYGHPRDTHRVIAGFWSVYLSESFDSDIDLTPRQAADMLDLLKDARKVTGPTADCYVDGAGYNAIGGELLADEQPDGESDANV